MKNIAHRGYSGKYPENTMLAFKKAIEIGADMIELDVTLSKDKIPVVIHDDSLERTTNGIGKIRNMFWDDFKNLDAGSWKNSKFKNEKIPSLEEVLVLIKKSKMALNIEIKSSAFEKNFSKSCIESQVLTLVQKHRLMKRVVISSFEPKVLLRLRRLSDSLNLSFLIEPKSSFSPNQSISFSQEIRAKSLNMHISQVRSKVFFEAKKLKIPVYVFTVNTVKEMRELSSLGVDGIFTNYPEKLLKKITL